MNAHRETMERIAELLKTLPCGDGAPSVTVLLGSYGGTEEGFRRMADELGLAVETTCHPDSAGRLRVFLRVEERIRGVWFSALETREPTAEERSSYERTKA